MLMPSTAARRMESAIKKWRGIILPQSWGGSELSANGQDSVGHGAGNQLLVVRSREGRDVGSGRRDFDRDGGGDNVVQRTERGSEGADGNRILFQCLSNAGGSDLT